MYAPPIMNERPRYSIVIPVYNRPHELQELLQSLSESPYRNFEVIIVEDGSLRRSDHLLATYRKYFPIQYFYKANEGPGPSRNFGFMRAAGDYFVVFDSDCVIPTQYFQAVDEALSQHKWDAWGGPDRAHEKFTPLQRAMGYTMSSILTTGGIRGGKKRIGWFQPRSFNMGISRKVWEHTGGFAFTRFAEDIELSIRMKNAGYKVGLIEDAFVYHKRRTTFRQFFTQVFSFGKGRILVGTVHPEEVKLTHWFPFAFTLLLIVAAILPFAHELLGQLAIIGVAGYFLAILVHSSIVNKSFFVGFLSVPAAFLQLTGYGIGFFTEWVKTRLRN